MLAFDHLVIFANSIETEQEKTAALHHLKILKGGQHEDWGTYNYLAFMNNNSYIEWLGIHNLTLAESSENPLIQQTANAKLNQAEGPIQFALRTNQMDFFIEHFNKEKIAFAGPFPGSRRKPDGSLLKWRMLFPICEESFANLPFLIEWEGEGNKPTNEEDLNAKSFSSITMGVKLLAEQGVLFQSIFHLEEPERISDVDGNPMLQWQLENGLLQLVNGETLEASFGEIVFRKS